MVTMNLVDEKVVAKEVKDSGEKLISVPTERSKLVLDRSVELGYENEFIARESVVKKLVEASRLLPENILLSVKETYRPLAFQEHIFNRRANRLSEQPANQGKSQEEIFELTAQFIAPPNVAGHPTGGAVDVSLVDDAGRELDMGCGYDQDEESSGGRCFSFSKDVSNVALSNREVLFSCMEAVGFVNYPYEWWHWSFGDKYWAAVIDAPNAIYGAITA